MGSYVKQCGAQILSHQESAKDPVLFVQQILDLKEKFDSIVQDAFSGDKKSQKKLKDAFEEFINKDSRAASHLAAYVDEALKNRLKGASEFEAEGLLERVIVIFRYLSDKDLFENYYKNLLAKRLLNAKSISDDAEKMVITKLKKECGYQFTSKLEGMFTDMKISRDTMDEFRSSNIDTGSTEIDVQMLTTGYWPLLPTPTCTLPTCVMECCEAFKSFYLMKHSGRRIAWMCQLGSADVKAQFTSGKYAFNVSTYQMCLLSMFNDFDNISLDQFREKCCIPEMEMKRHLLSLCTPKLRILKKTSTGKGIDENDVFTFNNEFTSKFRKIKVPLVASKEVVGVVDDNPVFGADIPEAVEEDRRHLVEAAIVRIMKARKKLSHNELVAEVSKQLSYRFSPSPPFIKKRVESLIERDYLDRDKEDRRIYIYLA